MLVASVGASVAQNLGLTSALAEEATESLTFGKMEPLVGALVQETPVNQLLPHFVQLIQGGTELRTLVAAGALANARMFAGQDYTGYHALIALVPRLGHGTRAASRRTDRCPCSKCFIAIPIASRRKVDAGRNCYTRSRL